MISCHQPKAPLQNEQANQTYEKKYGIDRAREIKLKLSLAQRGKNNSMYGKKFKPETLKKLSNIKKELYSNDFCREGTCIGKNMCKIIQ